MLFCRFWLLLFVLALLAVAGGCADEGTQLKGQGATFPAPLYARWIKLFERNHPNINVEYSAVGSSRGIQAITEREVDFGASDALLTDEQQQKLPDKLLVIPTVIGPVVLAYNLPDFEGELTLSGEVVAAIYLGEIQRWDDERLQELNPNAKLPDVEVRPAHRADGSGTTFIFTDYLSAVSEEWRHRVGKGTRVAWPTGDEWAGEGNDGVAHRILLLEGGIGYLELKYAQNAGLRYAALLNRADKRVWPTVASVQEAERNTPPAGGDHIAKPSIVNAPGARSYPICGFTYWLVYEDLTYFDDPAKAQALVRFLEWTLTSGQLTAPKLHYTPLPAPLQAKALHLVKTIRHGAAAGGK